MQMFYMICMNEIGDAMIELLSMKKIAEHHPGRLLINTFIWETIFFENLTHLKPTHWSFI